MGLQELQFSKRTHVPETTEHSVSRDYCPIVTEDLHLGLCTPTASERDVKVALLLDFEHDVTRISASMLYEQARIQ